MPSCGRDGCWRDGCSYRWPSRCGTEGDSRTDGTGTVIVLDRRKPDTFGYQLSANGSTHILRGRNAVLSSSPEPQHRRALAPHGIGGLQETSGSGRKAYWAPISLRLHDAERCRFRRLCFYVMLSAMVRVIHSFFNAAATPPLRQVTEPNFFEVVASLSSSCDRRKGTQREHHRPVQKHGRARPCSPSSDHLRSSCRYSGQHTSGEASEHPTGDVRRHLNPAPSPPVERSKHFRFRLSEPRHDHSTGCVSHLSHSGLIEYVNEAEGRVLALLRSSIRTKPRSSSEASTSPEFPGCECGAVRARVISFASTAAPAWT